MAMGLCRQAENRGSILQNLSRTDGPGSRDAGIGAQAGVLPADCALDTKGAG